MNIYNGRDPHMAEVQLQKVSVKHDAILDYLLANPATRLGDVARHFGVSQPWLSVIVHSDVFQARLQEKSQDMFHGTVVPLREQLLGVAHVGVEKLGEALENASAISDKEFIADTTDSILKNLGYSPRSAAPGSSPPAVVNNVMVVDRDTLAEAREKMRGIPDPRPALDAPTLSLEEASSATVEGGVIAESSMPPTEEL
jgi:hypothetical protein